MSSDTMEEQRIKKGSQMILSPNLSPLDWWGMEGEFSYTQEDLTVILNLAINLAFLAVDLQSRFQKYKV